MHTSTNLGIDDPDEMPQKVTFLQGLHCFLRPSIKRLSRKLIVFFLIIYFDLDICNRQPPNCLVSKQKEEPISA